VDDLLNRDDLSDEEWQRLAPLMPSHPRQGHRWNDHRTVIKRSVAADQIRSDQVHAKLS
jgi:transposase